MDWFSKAMTV